MDTTQALLLLGGSILFRLILKPVIYSLTKLTKTDLDDKIIDAVTNPLWFIVLFVVFDYFFETYIGWWAYARYVHALNYSFIILLVAIIVRRLTRIAIFDVFAKSKIRNVDERNKNTALIVMNNIATAIIFTIAAIYILSLWGVNVGPLLASAGIAGLVIGMALKDPLENLFYGIILALDPKFRVGDAVDIDGTSGVVEEISLRNTKIRTWDGNLVLLPNAKVANAKITNYEFPDERVRTSIVIGVSYDADPEEVKQTLLEVAKKNEKVLDDPEPTVLFTEFGDSALMFKLLYWTKRADKWSVLDEMNTAILKTFREKGIEIPYPITTVYLRKESENQ